jgi:flagellar hook assembly protein FlgD
VLDIDNLVQNNAPTNKFEVMVYPNPLQNDGTIRFNMKDNANVKVEIYNISGRLVHTHSEYMTSGTQNVSFDASKFDKGAYIVKVVAGDEVSSAKFIKH